MFIFEPRIQINLPLIRPGVHRLSKDWNVDCCQQSVWRLETKGLVSSREGEKTAMRGGRAKRYFQIEAPGTQALKSNRDATSSMIKGLESVLETR